MATVGELVVNLSANTASLEQGMARAERRVAGFGNASREGLRKAENAITDLGLRVAGLDGTLGRLAEGALLLGVGGTATVAITAGLATIGLAMRAVSSAGDAQATTLKEIADRYDGVAEAARRAGRTQLELDRATLEQRLRDLEKTPIPNNFEGWKRVARAGLMAFGNPDASMHDRIQAVVTRDKMVILEALAAVDTAMQEFDRRVRERQAAARPKTPGADLFFDQEKALRQMLARTEAQQGNFELDLLRQRKEAASTRVPTVDGIEAVEANLRTLGPSIEATLRKIDESWYGQQRRMARFTQEVWLQAARNIESALADTFDGIFSGQVKSLEDFARSVVSIVQRALAEIAAAEAAAGLAPVLRGAFGSGIGAAPDSSFLAGANAGVPSGFARAGANVVVHQHFNYAPTISAMDGQDVQRTLRQNRGALLAEMARMAQDSNAAANALGGRRR